MMIDTAIHQKCLDYDGTFNRNNSDKKKFWTNPHPPHYNPVPDIVCFEKKISSQAMASSMLLCDQVQDTMNLPGVA